MVPGRLDFNWMQLWPNFVKCTSVCVLTLLADIDLYIVNIIHSYLFFKLKLDIFTANVNLQIVQLGCRSQASNSAQTPCRMSAFFQDDLQLDRCDMPSRSGFSGSCSSPIPPIAPSWSCKTASLSRLWTYLAQKVHEPRMKYRYNWNCTSDH